MPRGVRAAGVQLGVACRKCGADEWKRKRKKTGYYARVCVPCARDGSRRRGTNRYHGDLPSALWSLAKQRAERSGLAFTITVEDVRAVWADRCPVFGIELRSSRGLRTDNSPSIDRKNNAWGYEPGNIAVVSTRANKLKSNATAAELESLAAWMRAHGLS